MCRPISIDARADRLPSHASVGLRSFQSTRSQSGHPYSSSSNVKFGSQIASSLAFTRCSRGRSCSPRRRRASQGWNRPGTGALGPTFRFLGGDRRARLLAHPATRGPIVDRIVEFIPSCKALPSQVVVSQQINGRLPWLVAVGSSTLDAFWSVGWVSGSSVGSTHS